MKQMPRSNRDAHSTITMLTLLSRQAREAEALAAEEEAKAREADALAAENAAKEREAEALAAEEDAKVGCLSLRVSILLV